MSFVSATKHLHYAGRFLSLQKDLSSAPAISERRGRRHIKYTIRHSQLEDIVNLLDISLVEKRMPLILHGKQMNNYTNINNNDNAKNIYPWT